MKTFHFLEIISNARPEILQNSEELAELLANHPDILKRLCAYLLEDKDALKHVIELLK